MLFSTVGSVGRDFDISTVLGVAFAPRDQIARSNFPVPGPIFGGIEIHTCTPDSPRHVYDAII